MTLWNAVTASTDWGTITTDNTYYGQYVVYGGQATYYQNPPREAAPKVPDTPEQWLRGRVREVCDLARQGV